MEFSTAGRLGNGLRRGRLAVIGMLALLMLASHGLHAQGVTAMVSPGKIRVGGYAVFTVTVEGGVASEIEAPKLPEGLELAGMGKSTSSGTTIINGQVSRSYSQSWQITATKPGKIKIPPQEVDVDGHKMISNEVELVVVERDNKELSQYDPLMSIELEKREFFEGEKIPLTATLYVHRQTVLRRVGLIEMPKDNFAIQRFPLQGEEGITRIGGVPYRVLTYQSTLSALKPGKFKLGPATCEVTVEVPTADNPFPHPLFSQSEPQKLKPQSNDIEVTVLPLPKEGRPKLFAGVVGDFTISLTAEPNELNVGEPISVEMIIEGSGNFDAIVAPTLTGPASDWKQYPARKFNMGSNDPMFGEYVNKVGFSQVIIPQKQVTEVPSFEFSFFSPTKKEYVTLRTPPVPLKVKPSPRGGQPVAQQGESSANAKSGGELFPEKVPQAQLSMTDILGSTADKPVWLGIKPLPWKDQRVLVGSAATGGLVLVLLLGKAGMAYARHRRNAPDAIYRELWSRLKSRQHTAAEFYAAAARLIQARGLSGAGVDEVLAKAEHLNFGPEQSQASTALDQSEQKRVLSVLNDAARNVED